MKKKRKKLNPRDYEVSLPPVLNEAGMLAVPITLGIRSVKAFSTAHYIYLVGSLSHTLDSELFEVRDCVMFVTEVPSPRMILDS